MQPILPSLNVNVVLFDTFSNMVLPCLLERLRVVRDEVAADISRTILNHTDAPALSPSGPRTAPDMSRAKAKPRDMLIVIGGDDFRADARDPGLRQSSNLTKTATTEIAADTGTWLLATAE